MKTLLHLLLSFVIIGLFQCSKPQTNLSGINPQNFDSTLNGLKVKLYTLKNENGIEVCITNYGGKVQSIVVPDAKGKFVDVALGYSSLRQCMAGDIYFGAIIGRYGNRIANGKFTLNGINYTLNTNNGPNSLHGGTSGFNNKVWNVDHFSPDSLQLSYVSKDMEEGYPGNLYVIVKYILTKDNGLKIDYEATTDRETVINLTNHAYFNLDGHNSGDILGHKLQIFADAFTPVDSTLIPTGEIRNVKGTAFDFTSYKTIGDSINAVNDQIKKGNGYDHNFVLRNQTGKLELAARVFAPQSGIGMDVFTTEPGLQFYTGNFLDGSFRGKQNVVYNFRNGLCLETQHYPDSPNHENFPGTVLKPGEKFKSTTVYKFGVQNE